MNVAYETGLGRCVEGRAEEVLTSEMAAPLKGKVDLIFTSPPFPLNRKKQYGNLQGERYLEWLAEFAPICRSLLRPKGSIVVEVGNSWEPGKPVMSTLALRALLKFLESGNFVLCQQFVYYNPARLPSPAQWVNVKRIRVKDAYTHLWWMSPTEWPKANNKHVLREYSESMQQLLRKKKYNSGNRPSQHNIGSDSFLTNNGGAIPSNVITLANTESSSDYLKYCRARKLQLHPARMPLGLPEFFVKMLTHKNDLVVDPFAGSNTTGAAAEALGRRWLAVEANRTYITGSRGRFPELATADDGPTQPASLAT